MLLFFVILNFNAMNKRYSNLKNLTLILFSFGLIFLCSFDNNNDDAQEVVEKFMTFIKNGQNREEMTRDSARKYLYFLTESYFDLYANASSVYDSQSWNLKSQTVSDTSVIIKSTGQTFSNSFGQPMKLHQEFLLKKNNGAWRIANTFNLIAYNIDFEIADNQWEFYWDVEKNSILNDLKKNVKLEILVAGHTESSSEFVKGELKITNNSNYDIKNLKILIDHFDSEGKSANTDNAYVSDIIRKRGYRELNWITGDCSKCVKQEFKISFMK